LTVLWTAAEISYCHRYHPSSPSQQHECKYLYNRKVMPLHCSFLNQFNVLGGKSWGNDYYPFLAKREDDDYCENTNQFKTSCTRKRLNLVIFVFTTTNLIQIGNGFRFQDNWHEKNFNDNSAKSFWEREPKPFQEKNIYIWKKAYFKPRVMNITLVSPPLAHK
jgi:hypothetical protein